MKHSEKTKTFKRPKDENVKPIYLIGDTKQDFDKLQTNLMIRIKTKMKIYFVVYL